MDLFYFDENVDDDDPNDEGDETVGKSLRLNVRKGRKCGWASSLAGKYRCLVCVAVFLKSRDQTGLVRISVVKYLQ